MDYTAARGRRVALVVGNSRYRHASLPNTSRDAEAVALALGRLGFASVKLFHDLPQSKFASVLADFGEDAEGAEVAVIYYAGHGMEVDGETFLLPVDAQPSHVRRLKFETQQLAGVVSAVSGAKALGLIVLDACRNNPFKSQIKGIEVTRSAVQGLSRIEPSGNVLVAYAARHGTVALDGTEDEHSPFTRAFLEFISAPNLDVRLLFGKIRDAVFDRTAGAQEPHLYGSLGGKEVYLNDATAPQAAFNIFISYARKDEERVGMLARILQTKGWNVFWDQDLLPGPNWREMIERRLRTAHCIVAVWSKHSIDSPWVNFEATRGMEKGILVPV